MKRLHIYKWSPGFRRELFLRKIFSHREEFLGYSLTIFCWEIRWFKYGVL